MSEKFRINPGLLASDLSISIHTRHLTEEGKDKVSCKLLQWWQSNSLMILFTFFVGKNVSVMQSNRKILYRFYKVKIWAEEGLNLWSQT